MRKKFAVQLHTVREELQQDFPGVLRELAAMGWAGVETAMLYDNDPRDIASVLKETGLQVTGMHVGYDRIVNELEEVLRDAETLRTRDLICPSIPPVLRHADGFREVKQRMNEAAAAVKGRGFRISYHNHAFEFETTIDGRSALEFLFDPGDGNNILAEPDVFWVKKGGYDPLAFIQPYAGRIPFIHLKDMTADENETFAEIGTGTIDFKSLLVWGERSGIEWYVVEQDRCPGPAMESIRLSYLNLVKISDSLR